jgi:hypothetical protein
VTRTGLDRAIESVGPLISHHTVLTSGRRAAALEEVRAHTRALAARRGGASPAGALVVSYLGRGEMLYGAAGAARGSSCMQMWLRTLRSWRITGSPARSPAIASARALAPESIDLEMSELIGCRRPGLESSELAEVWGAGAVPAAGFFAGGEFGPVGSRSHTHSMLRPLEAS